MDLVGDRMPDDSQYGATSADMQPPFHMPALGVVAVVHVVHKSRFTGIGEWTRDRRIASIAELGFVTAAAVGTLNAQHLSGPRDAGLRRVHR